MIDINPEVRGLESTRFAFCEFKRLLHVVMEHQIEFLPEVQKGFVALEARLFDVQREVEATARALFALDRADLARRFPTSYSSTEAMNGLHLGGETLPSASKRVPR